MFGNKAARDGTTPDLNIGETRVWRLDSGPNLQPCFSVLSLESTIFWSLFSQAETLQSFFVVASCLMLVAISGEVGCTYYKHL